MGRAFIITLFILGLTSCKYHKTSEPLTNNVEASDTAKVLAQAIIMGSDLHFMPGAGELKGRSHFKDTILLTSTALPVELLPTTLSGDVFKIMSKDRICTAFSGDSLSQPAPKYLNVVAFEKNDSGYSVLLQSKNCGEYASGGGLGLDFKKVGDTFIVIHRGASSIN